ncbi:MAG: hypothetical protein R6V33_09420 [Pelovirga sp.]
MLSDKNRTAYVNFYDAVRDETVLDRKTTILTGLAAAMAKHCDP